MVVGVSFLCFGAYELYKYYNSSNNDDNLIYGYENDYLSIQSLLTMELYEISSYSILSNPVFYSFCLDFFNNYDVNTFLNHLNYTNRIILTDFINFCKTEPNYESFCNFNIDKKILLNFSRDFDNYIRFLKNLDLIVYR